MRTALSLTRERGKRLAHMVTNMERSKALVLLSPTIDDLLPETRAISERPITFKLSLSANNMRLLST